MAARRKASDPTADHAALVASLAQDGLRRGYLLKGDELWFQDRGVDAIVAAAREAGLEVCRHDLRDPEWRSDFDGCARRVLDDLGALPMFASGRCVIVRHPADLLKKVGGKDSPFTRAALADLADEARTTTVVLAGPGIRADHPLAKAILAAGGMDVDCSPLKDLAREYRDPRSGQLVRWILARAKDHGLKLSNDDAFYLAGATGNDLAGLDDALKGLVASGGRFDRASIGWDSGGTPWQAADELLSGDPARALAAIETLFRSGFEQKDGRSERNASALATMMLGTLRGRARQGFTVAREMALGKPFPAAAEAAGLSGRWQLGQLEPLLAGRNVRDWASMLDDVGALERAVRSRAGVDENDFARIALRWRRVPGGRGARRR